MRNQHYFEALSIFALAACGGTGSTAMTPGHVDLTSTTYTLMPGEEKYFCYAMNMPKDSEVVITKIAPTYGEGTHHILFSQTLVPEPDGFTECNVLTRQTWVPLFAGGRDSSALTLPDNTGFKMLEKGQQVLMQLHILNATSAPISDKSALRIEYAPASSAIVAAGIFGFDNRKLELEPHMETKTTMSCKVDKHLKVFGVLAHMHKLGRHINLSRGASAGESMLYDAAWSFDTQPIVQATFEIESGDNIWLECTHNNTTDQAVAWGESMNTEMCASVVYYAPYDGLDGCVNE